MRVRAQVRHVERVDQRIHLDEHVPILRERCCVPAEGGAPAIAFERTVRVGGRSRCPVVLVHGLAQNRFTWRVSQRSLCAYLAGQGFEVLNVELRGHGLSREWGAPSATGFADYVEDVVRVVGTCRMPPFLMGHSLGGAVAIGVSASAQVRGLVHLAGVFGFAGDNRTLRALARLTVATQTWLGQAPMRVRTQLAGRLIGRLYRLTDVAGYGAPLAGWAPDSMERELLRERLERGFDWTSTEVWVEMSQWATGQPFPYAEAFGRSEVPLLVVAGDADPLVSHDDARRTFDASGSADKELLLLDAFEHRVHWGHIDLILGRHAPEIVWPQLLAWLERRAP
ncbi:MAG: lysophospholipase [Myxococcales bacterium]|nr:lysophospholipase [Myxococcales bacterium]